MRIVLWSSLALMLSSITASAQFQTQQDSLSTIKPISAEDSARIVSAPGNMNASRIDTASAGYKPTKSPGLALLFSGLLPGAGQFYNESYWKIPIVLGFGYYFASRWIDNNDSTKHYRTLYAQTPTNGTYQSLREFYKDQRDTFSWYIFIYYIVNLVDAYVDASLYDFNVGDDLSIRLMPTMNATPAQRVGLDLRIRF